MNRNLRFSNLEDVEKELKKLENSKVEASSFLNYYQILNHCADHIYFSMMGFPGRNWPFFIRKTYGKYKLSQIMEEGYIQPDSPLPYAPKENEDGNEDIAMDKLKKAIVDFRDYEGSLSAHPFYDLLTKELWEKFHSMYIANLLGFVNVVEKVEAKVPNTKMVEPSKPVIEESKPKKAVVKEPEKVPQNKTKIEQITTTSSPSKKKPVSKKTIPAPVSKKSLINTSKKKAIKEVDKPAAKKKPASKQKIKETVKKKR